MRTHASTHKYENTHTCTLIHTNTKTHTHTHIHTWHMHTNKHKKPNTLTWDAHTHVHTHTHQHTPTRTLSGVLSCQWSCPLPEGVPLTPPGTARRSQGWWRALHCSCLVSVAWMMSWSHCYGCDARWSALQYLNTWNVTSYIKKEKT